MYYISYNSVSRDRSGNVLSSFPVEKIAANKSEFEREFSIYLSDPHFEGWSAPYPDEI